MDAQRIYTPKYGVIPCECHWAKGIAYYCQLHAPRTLGTFMRRI